MANIVGKNLLSVYREAFDRREQRYLQVHKFSNRLWVYGIPVELTSTSYSVVFSFPVTSEVLARRTSRNLFFPRHNSISLCWVHSSISSPSGNNESRPSEFSGTNSTFGDFSCISEIIIQVLSKNMKSYR